MQPLYEYVCHMKGHRNSKGELAEWVIKSHETGKILSSHKSEQKAKEHLQQMHIFNEAAEGEEYCSHCGANVAGIEEYKGRKLCPSCLTQFKWLDEHRDPEDGTYEKYDLVPRETEDDEHEKEEFRSLLYDMANGYVNDINKFLQKYDISIELLDRETVESEELFDEDSQDLAMAFDSLRDDPKVTPIGLNESLIYDYYVEQFNESYTLFDEFMSDTLWHEAGHAICRYVEYMLDLLDATYIDDEEALVENFGFYMTSKTMHIDKDVSSKLLSKFNGAFAVMDAYNKGCYDDADFRKMLIFFSPNLDSEELAEILETHDIHKKQSASSIQDKKSDKLIGESTYGTDMDKRIKIFMEGVNQLGLSSRQVDAIGKLTNACMESALDDSTDEGLADSELLVYTPENDAEFFKEAFKRAAIKVQDKFPDRLYEDDVPEKGLVLVDKKSGNRFSLVLRKGPADPIHFDPNCHGIEVRIGSDRKEYPLWLRKSKSIDELIDLMFDCIAQEVRYASDDDELTYNHTGRGKKVHMEGVDMDGEPKDGPDSTDKFVTEAFYRAVSRLLVKYPNQLYEDEVAGVIGDKITGKKFSIDFDPRCYMIEVRTKDDRKTYPLWVNKSKSMNLLIELIMDIFSEELETTDNTTYDADAYEGVDYGRHVRTSEDEYDPENPEDPDDDIFYDGNGRVNELDPDEEPANF